MLLHVNSEDKSIELKRIAVDNPGQGVGGRLLRFLLEHAFDHCRAHRLYLDVDEMNPRAKAVYTKLGFREEGILREATCRDGRFFSMTLMSLLDREYRATQTPIPDAKADQKPDA
jgi:RimJ/RimL family protein N-acetyltransferase